MNRILLLAAHPDDEVLGMGATIKKLSKKGAQIHLCVVSEGASAQYNDEKMIIVRRESCIKSSKLLGIKQIKFLDFPDMRLDSIPHLEINRELEKQIVKFEPEIVYTTPNNDLNKDHQKVYESTLVVTRPFSSVKSVLCYEMPGTVNTPFCPNLYEDVTKEFHFKLRAFKFYWSEVEKSPHPRSIEAINAIATYRGNQSGLKKAEAFQLIRNISI
jgi:LmbE family N-acetylglucosaminyl deacetylase